MSIIGAVMVPHPPIIIPQIGKGEERKIRKTKESYRQAADYIVSLKPETIIISSPHSVMYADYFHISPGQGARGDFARFRAPQVKFKKDYDTQLVGEICRRAEQVHFPAGIRGERDKSLDHGTMIPLYFIDQAYAEAGKTPDYQIIRIGLSGLPLRDHYRLGMLVRDAVNGLGRRTVWVASGDLSHKCKADGPYGYDPAGPEYDRRIMDVMGSGEFDRLLDFDENFCEKAAECGHRSFTMMAGALDGTEVTSKKLSHEDIFGVGYGVCIFQVPNLENANRHFLDIWEQRQRKKAEEKFARQDPYVSLARLTLETYIREHHRVLTWPEAKDILLITAVDETCSESLSAPALEGNNLHADLPDSSIPEPGRKENKPDRSLKDALTEMEKHAAGVFVSIHEGGNLRGCIGTISATCPCIAQEIISNAISAGTRDPRFDPIREDELDKLEYSVDVLGEAEDIASEDELDVRRYGVIVTKGRRRGLLLPNLDGVDTVSQQVQIAKQKAGLSPHEKGCQLQRFEVVRHY